MFNKNNTTIEQNKNHTNTTGDNRILRGIMIALLLAIVIILDALAIIRIAINITSLDGQLEAISKLNAELVLTIINIVVDLLEVIFSIGLLIPSKKQSKTRRYARRISTFFTVFVGYTLSLLLYHGKEMAPAFLEGNYEIFKKKLALVIILFVMLVVTLFAKFTCNSLKSRLSKIIGNLYLVAGVSLIYGVYLTFFDSFTLVSILQLVLAICTLIFIFIFQRIAPEEVMESRQSKVLMLNGKKCFVMSKESEHKRGIRIPGVLGCIFSLAVLGVTLFTELLEATKLGDISGFFYILIFAVIAFVMILEQFKCFIHCNGKNLIFTNLYLLPMMIAFLYRLVVSEGQFSTLYSFNLVRIEMDDTYTMLGIFIALLPVLGCFKRAMSLHKVSPFEECTTPLKIADIYCIILVIIVTLIFGKVYIELFLLLISLIMNIRFMSKVKKKGFLEYVKASNKEIVEGEIYNKS